MLSVTLWCMVCAWREERGRGWTFCEDRRVRAAERRARVWRESVCVWLRLCGLQFETDAGRHIHTH